MTAEITLGTSTTVAIIAVHYNDDNDDYDNDEAFTNREVRLYWKKIKNKV